MASEFAPGMRGLRICIDTIVLDPSGKLHSHVQQYGTLLREGDDGYLYWVPQGKRGQELIPHQSHVRHALKSIDSGTPPDERPTLVVNVRGTYYEQMISRDIVRDG